jgi:hypothetical protein
LRKNNYVIDIEGGNCLLKYCIKSKMFLFKNLLKIVNQKREIKKSLWIKKLRKEMFGTYNREYFCGGREKVGKSKMIIFQGNDSKFHIIPKIL